MRLGVFDDDGYPDLVVGMPRGANLTGKVLLLSGRSMTQLHNVTGAQVSLYFNFKLEFITLVIRTKVVLYINT